MFKRFIFISPFLALILLVSCADDPTSIGANIIPDSDHFVVDTLDSYSNNMDIEFDVYRDEDVTNGSSSALLIGKYNNVVSTALIKYYIYLPDSIYNPMESDFNNINVLDAWIEFTKYSSWGDTLQDFQFEGFAVTEDWTDADITRSELEVLVNTEAIDYSSDLASNTGFINSDTISVNLDTDIVYEWMKNSVDEDAAVNNGIYLRSKTGNELMYGFYAISSSDVVNISKLKMVVEYPGEFVDTITATVANDVHIIEGTPYEQSENRVVIQGAFPTRSAVKFDINSLPVGAVVNKAVMEFSIDSVNSVEGSVESDNYIGTFYVAPDSADTDYGLVLFSRESNRVSGDITSYVQRWVSGLDNHGFRLSLYDETSTINKIVIYRENIDVSYLKPRVLITYTIQR